MSLASLKVDPNFHSALQQISEAFPRLSEPQRAAVLALVASTSVLEGDSVLEMDTQQPADAPADDVEETSLPAELRACLDRAVSPRAIFDELRDDDDCVRALTILTGQILATRAPATVIQLREMLYNADNGFLLEEAAREAGFLLGFEYGRRLAGGGR